MGFDFDSEFRCDFRCGFAIVDDDADCDGDLDDGFDLGLVLDLGDLGLVLGSSLVHVDLGHVDFDLDFSTDPVRDHAIDQNARQVYILRFFQHNVPMSQY